MSTTTTTTQNPHQSFKPDTSVPVNPEAKQKAKQVLDRNPGYIEYVENFGTKAEKDQVQILKIIAGVE